MKEWCLMDKKKPVEPEVVAKEKKVDYSKRTMAEAIAASVNESRKFRI